MFDDRRERREEAASGPASGLDLGRVVMTAGAIAALREAGLSPEEFLERHARGDWGDLCAEDRAVNRRALLLGHRVYSRYPLPTGEKLWIITEGDRFVTTLFLPQEY